MIKKGSILLSMFFLVSFYSIGQFGIKAGFSLGIPTISNEAIRTYTGAYFGINYQFNEHIVGEIKTDASFHRTQTIYIDTLKCIFPVTIGMNYLFTDHIVQPFIGIGAGLYAYHQQSENWKKNQYYFGIQPRFGLHIELAEHLYFDAAVIYHAVVATRFQSLFGINAGIEIQL